MVILSFVLHVVGFGGAIGLPRLLPREPLGTPVYVVDLVSLPAPAPIRKRAGGGSRANKKSAPTPKPPPKEEKAIEIPEPKKPKPQPKKEKPKPKKIEEPPAKIEKPVEPRKVEPESRDDAATDTATGSAEDAAPSSTIGGRGTAAIGIRGGTGNAGGDALTFYFNLLKMRIESNWQRPIYPPNYTDRRTLLVTVRLGLSSSGRVTSLELLTPSGYIALDRSILRAVRDAEPFPPFPPQMTRLSIAIPIEFVFNPD